MKFRILSFSLLAMLLSSCSMGDAKTAQYFVQGERLYEQHCSNCHQADGTGLGKLYPSLVGSQLLKSNSAEVVCWIRYGSKNDSITGDRPMMPGNPGLTDLEIAELMTYLTMEYAEGKEIFDVRQSTCEVD